MSAEMTLCVQTDVIEVQTAKFMQRMKLVDSLHVAQKAHELYIDTITAQSFLDEPAIMEAISMVLAQCQQLSNGVQV